MANEKSVVYNGGDDFVFIDVQGFRDRHRFICKEFSLIDGDFKYHAIVKSPYSFRKLNDYFKRHATWAMNYFHGLSYDCGDVNITEVISKIYPKIMKRKIVVQQPWKITWLQYIFRHCGELDCVCFDDLGLDTSKRNDVYDICNYHNITCGWKERQCALANTLEMYDIMKKNNSVQDSVEIKNEMPSDDEDILEIDLMEAIEWE